MKEEKIKTAASKGRYEQTTIVGKMGDSVTIEIKNLPEDFSFAYTFFRNIGQECRLLKREIEKAQNRGDKVIATYLESALQFFKDHPVKKNFYVGGLSFSPVLDAIQTLAFQEELLFTTSVAGCIRDRIEREISLIHQEYEYCKEILDVSSNTENIDQAIIIIRKADTLEEAIEKLQSEMSLTAGAAECICAAPLPTITNKDLVIQKISSMEFLLSYLKHLQSLNI